MDQKTNYSKTVAEKKKEAENNLKLDKIIKSGEYRN